MDEVKVVSCAPVVPLGVVVVVGYGDSAFGAGSALRCPTRSTLLEREPYRCGRNHYGRPPGTMHL